MSSLRLTVDGTRATLWIERPERRNALTQQMWEQIPQELARLPDDVRVVLIRSAVPGIFCAGADIREYREHAGDVAWGQASNDRVAAALRAIRDLPMPTLAIIDGPCIGGGAAIALAADLRACSLRSRFAITPAKLGLVFPGQDVAALTALIGPAASKQLLLTGETYDARWAERVGFTQWAVPIDDLDDTVEVVATSLQAVSPTSTQAMKKMIDAVSAGKPLTESQTSALSATALAGPDHAEGTLAFLERRAPEFTTPPPWSSQ